MTLFDKRRGTLLSRAKPVKCENPLYQKRTRIPLTSLPINCNDDDPDNAESIENVREMIAAAKLISQEASYYECDEDVIDIEMTDQAELAEKTDSVTDNMIPNHQGAVQEKEEPEDVGSAETHNNTAESKSVYEKTGLGKMPRITPVPSLSPECIDFVPDVFRKFPSGRQNESDSGGKLSADVISDIAIERYSLKQVNGIIYAFESNSYHPLSSDMIKGCIWEGCSEELAKTKDNHIIHEVFYCIRAKLSRRNMDDKLDFDHIVFKDCRFNLINQQFEYNGPDVLSISYVNVKLQNPLPNHPIFDRYLHTVSGGDERLERLIWEIIAYILSPSMMAKKFFVFYGPSGTGKSLMLRLIRSFFIPNIGECAIQLHSLGDRFCLGTIAGIRLVTDGDYAGTNLSDNSTATIKAITGGDSVRAERKGQDAVTITPCCKLLIASNYIPTPKTTDEAFSKRMVVVPFFNVIPDESQDPDLFEKLHRELPAIAIDAINNLVTLRNNKYRFTQIDWSKFQPDTIETSYTSSFVPIPSSNKLVSDFVNSMCVLDDQSYSLTSELFESFKYYCTNSGQKVLDIKDFSSRLHKLYPELSKRKKGSKNVYCGIAVKKFDN